MAKKKQETMNEFHIHCPLYQEMLDECPSSSAILTGEDLRNLKKYCLSEEYSGCKLYLAAKEKSQAA